MTVNASGKIQLTTNPALPATCVVCNKGANNSSLFIDFGVNLDWYGSVNICEFCVRESLELLQCVPVAQVKELEEQLANLKAQALELEENNVRLNSTLDNLLSLRPGVRPSTSVSTESDDKGPEADNSGPTTAESGLFE